MIHPSATIHSYENKSSSTHEEHQQEDMPMGKAPTI